MLCPGLRWGQPGLPRPQGARADTRRAGVGRGPMGLQGLRLQGPEDSVEKTQPSEFSEALEQA